MNEDGKKCEDCSKCENSKCPNCTLYQEIEDMNDEWTDEHNCTECKGCTNCKGCINCEGCELCYDCIDCTDCIGLIAKTGWRNNQPPKEEGKND